MNCYPINATSIKAYWAHGLLYLTASGECECPQYASISETMITIYPPEYQITTCACSEIGLFPYNVHAWFHLAEQPEAVTVHTQEGPQKVEVEAFAADLSDDLGTPEVLTAKLSKGEVIGLSPNSWDINRAISYAVGQLEKLYPGNVNAELIETGVVAAGSPVGVAFLYVRMKQSAAKGSATKSSANKSSANKSSATKGSSSKGSAAKGSSKSKA